uniref:DUF104 domain-containing protein n=1 Tax=Schlesneria paludicola TaxID=360056 RepID=A0A7C4QVV0_9PLAN
MMLAGHVHKGVIVLDEPATLPEGTPVRVEVLTPEDVSKSQAAPARRQGGQYAGQIWMAPDFDEWPPDLQEALGMTP